MLVLNRPHIGNIDICPVHYSISLKVIGVIHDFGLKSQSSVFQMTERISEVFINRPCEDYFSREAFKFGSVSTVITVKPDVAPVKQFLCNRRESVNGYSLIESVEIIIVILESYG